MQKFLINAKIQIKRPVLDNDSNPLPGTDKPFSVETYLSDSTKTLKGENGEERKSKYFICIPEENLPKEILESKGKTWMVLLPYEDAWFKAHDVKMPSGRYIRNVQFYLE
ncbi:hypothetical protein FH593_20650 (plasmid) [Leptospira interrogans]|uniref:hypothetical protein n=1 Tax=Leptospira interrogans TaxID=173 RepID=UPI0002C0298A|nr:hypothetical protein [Leptospira interrogans]EMN60326.1 hypothetical protein LEP1GSC092_0028 [Leptospira interrogans serovar Pyrogenes str. R168]ULG90654.1 hypothetical protein FH593_20650 [Leptospira interrogans]UML78418.1 hypothetical protein FH583_21745 [Leptospira interrogans]